MAKTSLMAALGLAKNTKEQEKKEQRKQEPQSQQNGKTVGAGTVKLSVSPLSLEEVIAKCEDDSIDATFTFVTSDNVQVTVPLDVAVEFFPKTTVYAKKKNGSVASFNSKAERTAWVRKTYATELDDDDTASPADYYCDENGNDL